MANYKARLQLFTELFEKDTITVTELQKLCFNGIPDGSSFRSMCWKILLNYLPVNKAEWPAVLLKQRNLYDHFVEEMIVTPGSKNKAGSRIDVTLDDHPLNPNPDGKWMAYFKDNEVLLQINKDVRRLCPDISFFQQATDYPCESIVGKKDVESLRDRVEQTVLRSANVTRNRLGITNVSLFKKRAQEEYQHLSCGQEAHWEVVERILFIYAKLNPGQSYVQGMNEIIGPIYYTFASDPDPEWKKYAEADSFFCFTNLMSEIRDFFIKTLDDSASGIGAMMKRLMNLLQEHDFNIWQRLQMQDLKPQYYSFRWITLLLSQEFPLPDVIRVWDSLFADKNRFEFLIYVCCAMILWLRDKIMQGDFSANMKLLQNFPNVDIHCLLEKAVELQR
ncbi:TBC1 domain family member 13-like [Stegodyphus dumicola]|uniref:TBC1 domain family member 13-like n=1 Tax=Stegodyphus dumicola TaxID=202533 RepID=UPI0015A8CCBB|nr:TBC1 domain family member 13-like [Stegodyphus dumicola]XP_035225795.1 TBC1 domain family member 13-like [Stegodyphus dumicola]XP_035225796.1 TBC1 domain family member 13-like [Stegodyphus dumicola]